MTQQVTITWKAFGDRPEANRFISTVEFKTEFPETITDQGILNICYADTNLYQGYIWGKIEALLSPTRTHTALSVGDEIAIDGRIYEVANTGFTAKVSA